MWGEERFLGEESRDVYDPCNPFGHGGGGDERQSPA
jgi:hypothetical protein